MQTLLVDMKILFVCHGNICRSPMAEYIMKEIAKNDNFTIESRATSFEEIGNDIYYLAKDVLKKNNIPFTKHYAKRITKEDYQKFDYIIVMDEYNKTNLLRIVGEDKLNKVYKLLSFIGLSKDVDDPWYTRRFDECFNEIYSGCKALYEHIKNN